MADQYLNKTGLTYYHNRIKTEFENKIETVKVNGTALVPDAQKAVDVKTPVLDVAIMSGEIDAVSIVNKSGGNTEESIQFAKSIPYDGCIQLHAESGNLSEGAIDCHLASVAYVNENGGKIDEIQVNGTAQTITDKTVNIAVPTATSQLTNDGDGTSNFATEDYVDANGGKIDRIRLNGTNQTITNKTVDLNVVSLDWEEDRSKIMKAGGLSSAIQFIDDTNGVELAFGKGSASSQTYVYKTLVDKTYVDNTFRTEAQIQSMIDAELADITGIDFQVVDALPASGVKGTIYLLHNATAAQDLYDEYIWVTPEGGTAHWEQIGTSEIDLTDYWAKTELTAMTTAEIDEILNA